MSSEDKRERIELALGCWYVTGATASGKTSVGIELARLLNAEIISLDSMAIYRGMDIGTAKPSPIHCEKVPHHLLDIVDPIDPFSVSQYREMALNSIDDIRSRGKEVLVVGGTALYLKALLRGLFDGPPADQEFRQQIEAELANVDNHLLHDRLANVDPISAHKLHPNDRRRIIRALEVFKLTGQPISHWQMEFEDGHSAEECRVFTLRHDRSELHRRIERRVMDMFDEGLIDEVKSLQEKWGRLGDTASQAVGYREVFDFLNGELTHNEMIEKVRNRTRKFARHQETWFRGLSECHIIDLELDFVAERTAHQLFEQGSKMTAGS